ncbi:hypothetical protein TRVL_04790 [Trypanosoma vivax]|uniref:Uncharacterized protein n=1 Tax=Trypanosoma vivax (strain Y486) TaxID=1055687 RepID=G0TXI0_TRYVY|nr:hypothetical protein TRVL_04790 [Trypanosoma vivax]CCC48670.1 hypothetical protein TVY486_0700140 [Trypanosoma vivax Y486]
MCKSNALYHRLRIVLRYRSAMSVTLNRGDEVGEGSEFAPQRHSSEHCGYERTCWTNFRKRPVVDGYRMFDAATKDTRGRPWVDQCSGPLQPISCRSAGAGVSVVRGLRSFGCP